MLSEKDFEKWFRYARIRNTEKDKKMLNLMRLAMHGSGNDVSDQNVNYNWYLRQFKEEI
jgi:hypothetical protein